MTLTNEMGWDFGSPIDTDMSMDFDYTSWNENTELLFTNVPWNTDYRDIVQMDGGLPSLNTWLDAQPNYKYTNASMQKFNEGIVKIDLPMNEAMKFNYLRARNGVNPVTNEQRDYYYFVTGIRYGAPETTWVSLQLDVITTFFYEVKFGYSYVERGHIGIANLNQFNAYGREYLTVPEGLDLGGEYRTVHAEFEPVMDNSDNTGSNTGLGYDVLVCSTLDLTQDPGTIEDPGLNSATGSRFQGIPAGASFYVFKTGYDLATFFLAYTSKPWITQSIISITLIPNLGRYYPGYDYGTNLSTNSAFAYYAAADGGNTTPATHTTHVLPNWRNEKFINNILGPAYSKLRKFLTYPYMVIELTTFSGSPLIIKPEAWQDPDATITELAGLVPPGQRVVIMPKKYNWDPETDTDSQTKGDAFDWEDYGEFLDFAVTLSDFVQVPVVNNMAAAFLAQNKNGINFQFSSADWAQQRALSGAQAAYDVQNAQMGNTARQSGIANTANSQATALGATAATTNSIIGAAGSVADLGTGAVGSMRTAGASLEGGRRSAGASNGQLMGAAGMGAAGGIGSAGAGMVQAGVSAQAALQQAVVANTARGESAISDIQTAGSVRDTNNAYATMAAKGDYANAIAGVQAKLQDAKMIQPSVNGQFGGDAFNLINNKYGYSLRWKMANLNSLRTLGNYWLRYGYAINQFIEIPDSLHCMTKFTYWKLSETYLSQGAFPEGFKQIIRGIFEKGVTVWRNPDDIGRTALSDNQPIDGIRY